MPCSSFSRLKNVNLILFLFFSASLIIAFAAEAFYKIRPCHLCLYIRYLYWLVLSLTALRLRWPFSGLLRWGQFFTVLSALALSGFHAGVEKKWWEAPAVCSNPVLENDTNKVSMTVQQRIAMIRQNIESAEIIRCDRVNWSILGVSVTVWNTIALFFIALFLFFNGKHKTNEF